MEQTPSISVVTIAYQHEKYIAEAIQSILDQTLTDFELIVVNDGSTDRTDEIIRSFQDDRIIYIYQENQGPSAAANTGILASSAKYIALMSGDDVSYPQRLAVEYQHLHDSGNRVVFSWVDFIDDDSQPFVGEHFAQDFFNHPQRNRAEMLNWFFMKGNYLCAVTALVEKKILVECGLFNPVLIQLQDFEMWVKIVKKYDISLLEDKLVKYRVRAGDNNLSSDPTNSVRSIFEGYQLYRQILNHLPIELFRSSFVDALDRPELLEGDSYELAKAFVYLKHDLTLLRYIGIEKLFNLLQDERTLRFSKSKYNFGLPELYTLTKDADITNSRVHAELSRSQSQLHQTQVELAQAQFTIKKIMASIHLFTSITANYIPKARVLAKSVKKFHPDYQFHIILSDRVPSWLDLDKEPFDTVITIEELSIPNLKSWIFKHTLVEMCTGVKGFAFQEIVRRYQPDYVFFFDPDIVILSPLDSLIEKLTKNSILLTPHQTEPERLDRAIVDNEICSLKHGVFNLGFLGIRSTPGSEGLKFIDWWAARLENYCYDDKLNGLFTDQRWVDLAPAFFSDLCITREPIYNVATWNLTHRVATGSIDRGIEINGQPICFYHFSGFDSGDQEIMLKQYGKDSPVLFELRDWYIEQCQLAEQDKLGEINCIYGCFDNGEVITKLQRIVYRSRVDLHKAFPDPYATTDLDKSYLAWCQQTGTTDAIEFSSESPEAMRSELVRLQTELSTIKSSRSWRLVRKLLGKAV